MKTIITAIAIIIASINTANADTIKHLEEKAKHHRAEYERHHIEHDDHLAKAQQHFAENQRHFVEFLRHNIEARILITEGIRPHLDESTRHQYDFHLAEISYQEEKLFYHFAEGTRIVAPMDLDGKASLAFDTDKMLGLLDEIDRHESEIKYHIAEYNRHEEELKRISSEFLHLLNEVTQHQVLHHLTERERNKAEQARHTSEFQFHQAQATQHFREALNHDLKRSDAEGDILMIKHFGNEGN